MALPALRWQTFQTQDPNIEGVGDVFGAEVAAMQALGLTGVQQQGSGDVVGHNSKILAAAGVLQCGKTFSIIVIVTGNSDSDVKPMLASLVKEIPKHLPNL